MVYACNLSSEYDSLALYFALAQHSIRNNTLYRLITDCLEAKLSCLIPMTYVDSHGH